MTTSPLTWLHVGDLHIKDPGGQNLRDLHAIVGHVAALAQGGPDFLLLPGDNADDGTVEQFAAVRDAIKPLRLPVHVLTGDHDFVPGTLSAFHDVLGAPALPYASTVRGHRCLFLDVVSAGSGGPDFRLGQAQLDWLEQEVEAAAARGQDVAVFMHTYPADLREGADRVGKVLERSHVACVDMGHTHYNELANDGRTIFMATRSTGQVEEGPPGFSLAAVDGGCVSWRFKPLEQPWPFVLVTSPADRRLATGRSTRADPHRVRARVLGDAAIEAVTLHADGAPARPMAPVGGAPGLWEAMLDAPAGRITVRARDALGREDEDEVEPAPAGFIQPRRHADGSDRDAIESWPGKGIAGGQLGPNRHGRKW